MTDTSVSEPTIAARIAIEAVRAADELDQIRSVYGEECVTRVKRALHQDPEPDWRAVIDRAVREWESTTLRVPLDFTL